MGTSYYLICIIYVKPGGDMHIWLPSADKLTSVISVYVWLCMWVFSIVLFIPCCSHFSLLYQYVRTGWKFAQFPKARDTFGTTGLKWGSGVRQTSIQTAFWFTCWYFGRQWNNTLCKKATIHQVTTMLTTSKNVLFPGHNHLLTTGTDDLTPWLLSERQRVKGHQYRWLPGDYDLEIEHF